MKKKYISPAINSKRLKQCAQLLQTSGSVNDSLDPPTPTDPKDGEVMSAKGGAWDYEW